MKVYQSVGGYYFKEYKNGKKMRISREQFMKLNKSQKGGVPRKYVWRIDKQETKLHIKKLDRSVHNYKLKVIELDYDLQHSDIIKTLQVLLYVNTRIKYNITFDSIEKGTIIYNIENEHHDIIKKINDKWKKMVPEVKNLTIVKNSNLNGGFKDEFKNSYFNSNRLDFSDRIVINIKDIINPFVGNNDIKVGYYIFKNGFDSYIIATTVNKRVSHIILCIDADDEKVVIQPKNGSIKVKHGNMDGKEINDFIPDDDIKKSGFLIHKDNYGQINLIETDTGKYIRYCEDTGNPISINGIVYNNSNNIISQRLNALKLDVRDKKVFVILGAGPFGLLLALLLSQQDTETLIIIVDNRIGSTEGILSSKTNNDTTDEYKQRAYDARNFVFGSSLLGWSSLYGNLLNNYELFKTILKVISEQSSKSVDIILTELLKLCTEQTNIKKIFTKNIDRYLSKISIHTLFDCTAGRYKQQSYTTLIGNNKDMMVGYGEKRYWKYSDKDKRAIKATISNYKGVSYNYELSTKFPAIYNSNLQCIQILCGSGFMRTSPLIGKTISISMDILINLLYYNKTKDIENYYSEYLNNNIYSKDPIIKYKLFKEELDMIPLYLPRNKQTLFRI